MEKETTLQSYERHAEHEAFLKLASCYTHPDSVDAWRHNRMIYMFSPLIKCFPDAKFLTIGDGRYGSDAHLLKKQNVNVLASSLTDNYLKVAKEKGYIDDYLAVNAEKIQFEDNSFDFVLCKESYHHFPRPPIAFYEMLRVAKIAVILIEPTDDRVGLIDFLKRPLKKMLRNDAYFDYEDCGNYIYRANSKEIKKMLMAMDKPLFAVKYFNDFYMDRLAGANSTWGSSGFLLTKFAVFVQDVLSFLRLMNYGKATLMAFKSDIPAVVKSELKKKRFKLSVLPKNPYL